MTHDVQGIYQIKNLKNDKVYIGSSKAIYKRWYDHKSKLLKNKHDNPYLQHAWNKYGEECFKFSIIEKIEDSSLLLIKETEHILKNKSTCPALGYNIDIPTANERRIELYKIEKNNSSKQVQSIVQVEIKSGQIINRFESQLKARAFLNLTERGLSTYVERNTFQARSQKKSRLLHPYQNTILMYEKYYKPDFDYKSAIKVGELVEVVRGSYKEILTRYEFQDLLGREVNDYTWPKLRSISYNQSKVDYEGFTLTFLRKSVRDETRTLKTISVREEKTIVAIKSGEIIKTYSNTKEMTADLGIDHKHTLRLLAKSNGKKGKKRRQGILYYYKDQL